MQPSFFITLFSRVFLTVYCILGMQNAPSIVNAEVLAPTLSGESNRQQRGTSDDVIDLKPVLWFDGLSSWLCARALKYWQRSSSMCSHDWYLCLWKSFRLFYTRPVCEIYTLNCIWLLTKTLNTRSVCLKKIILA